MRKVAWATRAETLTVTLVVAVTLILMVALVLLVDTLATLIPR